MNKDSIILIVGHDDITEKSLVKYFETNGFNQVFSSSKMGLNPTIQPSVYEFFQEKRPEYVFLGSTRSGGIKANQESPGEFIYHNLESQNNVIYSANKFGVKKLLYYASSCVYPKGCTQPMKEDQILTGPLEETSQAYATAKLAGIAMCQAYRKQYDFNAIVAIPATVYGPDSDTNSQTAHVIGALLAKFQEAAARRDKKVEVWGSGNPRREFLYADDFVQASLQLMEKYNDSAPVNIGIGEDIAIKELAEAIAAVTGFTGEIRFDLAKPDGVMQKLLDNQRIQKLGWQPKVLLKEGIAKTHQQLKEG